MRRPLHNPNILNEWEKLCIPNEINPDGIEPGDTVELVHLESHETVLGIFLSTDKHGCPMIRVRDGVKLFHPDALRQLDNKKVEIVGSAGAERSLRLRDFV